MKNKIIMWILIVFVITILVIGGLYLITNNSDKKNNINDKKPVETNEPVKPDKPVDPIVGIVIEQNPDMNSKDLELSKEQENGKYKVIDNKQSNKNKTVYYLIDPTTKKVERISKITMTVGNN